ncbi:antitoxin [Streptomyces sp. NRRL S-87]|uniref:antitoxin n=1 Tax=Streptomyces sp. NRRL S-87 TaxID=1463920 RepID=UPI00099D2743|nr:antitoxin [Streptomyces sp. NRRL S-87]
MGIMDRARELLRGEHGKKLSDAAEKQVDDRTGNKYTEQVDQAQQQVEKQLGIDDDPHR